MRGDQQLLVVFALLPDELLRSTAVKRSTRLFQNAMLLRFFSEEIVHVRHGDIVIATVSLHLLDELESSLQAPNSPYTTLKTAPVCVVDA